jgi:hypothetical protein
MLNIIIYGKNYINQLYRNTMNFEDYEDLNKAKQKIMSLLKTKYGDMGDDYQESVDADADGKMNNIIKQLDEAHSHSFNIIPFIKK